MAGWHIFEAGAFDDELDSQKTVTGARRSSVQFSTVGMDQGLCTGRGRSSADRRAGPGGLIGERAAFSVRSPIRPWTPDIYHPTAADTESRANQSRESPISPCACPRSRPAAARRRPAWPGDTRPVRAAQGAGRGRVCAQGLRATSRGGRRHGGRALESIVPGNYGPRDSGSLAAKDLCQQASHRAA